jgi:hypothetical protein
MKVLKIDMKRLRNEEWFNIYSELTGLIPAYGAQTLGIADLLALLIPLHDKTDQLLEIVHKSTYTKELKEADKERGTLFKGFYGVVKNSLRLPADADKAAAERLFVLLSSYRKTAVGGSYAEESSAMFNLLQDLRRSYAADIALLGVGKWVQNLEVIEQKFTDFRDARDKEQAAKPTEHLKRIRPQVDALYKNMMDVLYARLVVDGLGGDVDFSPEDLKTGPYEENVPEELKGNVAYNFVVAWNFVVRRYRTMLAERAGRKVKEENPPEPGEGDQPVEDL